MTELFEKSIRVLELPQLLERLSQKAVSEAAKERALRLTPSTDADDVRRLQDETDAARALIGLRGTCSAWRLWVWTRYPSKVLTPPSSMQNLV